jgi:hypothetical protein
MLLIVKAGVDTDPFIMDKGQIITPRGRVIPEKLIIPQLDKTFPPHFMGPHLQEPVAGPYSVPGHKK